MPFSLPRALSPVRLFVIFLVLFCLLFFRTYYLPSPSGDSSYGISSVANSWWPGSSSSGADDLSLDVDLDHALSESEQEDEFADPLTLFPDHSTTHSSQSSPTPSSKSASSSSHKGSPTSSAESSTSDDHHSTSDVPLCRQLPGADKVVVMVKTGASEVLARIPGLLLTFQECIPNFMVFSDMEQDLGDYHIYDALDEIGDEWKEKHEDFNFYRDLQDNFAAHGDVSRLDASKAWNLDKWKNIPMLHKAYTKYPDADWFVTIDADTYLGWTNLLLLLKQLDPNEPLYAGCIYWHADTAFAQGGTGYLLSRKAVQKFEDIRDSKTNDWEKETSTSCCGDVMLSVAMGHAGVSVSGAWPMFQVDPPSGLEWWSDDYWCRPTITWHHSRPYEIESLWQFEKEWINETWDDAHPGSKPYLFKDLFESFIQPHLEEYRADWDNLSANKEYMKPLYGDDDEIEGKKINEEQNKELEEKWEKYKENEQKSTEGFDDCQALCKEDEECYQWSWKPGICRLHHSIRLGNAASAKLEVVSGWMPDRIEEFKKKRQECKELNWKIG